MDYHLGLLVPYYCSNWKDEAECELIITVKDNHFILRSVPLNLFSERWVHHSRPYYTFLDFPILYREDDKGEIAELVFLSSLSISNHKGDEAANLVWYLPFWEYQEWFSDELKSYIFSGSPRSEDYIKTTVFSKGVDLFSLKNNYYHKSFYFFEDHLVEEQFSSLFSRLFLSLFSIKCVVKSIETSHDELDSFSNYEKTFYQILINTIKQYVESISIEKIVSGLSVIIEEHFVHRAGRDDIYIVSETTSCVDSRVYGDSYLSELLDLGSKDTYTNRGFCPAEDMALPGLKTGPLDEDEMRERKQQIIERYSKENHVGNLLANTFSLIQKNQSQINDWKRIMSSIYQCMTTVFHIDYFEHHTITMRNWPRIEPLDYISKMNDVLEKETIFTLEPVEISSLFDLSLKMY